ncbi:type II toxin-antitoxin system HicB family antitoxin [Chromatium okenii]|jgi:predicted RNase H-like HicB family nuclease|uniref:HicB-like antitoxin of toxin-antitoxin system domain-containing protein n=1 Tax=Chromatium okenii TaxID=61644 RepID=A0A2S7XQ24_9GAMM|nr:type II toxin-antitoxin system HicB family antitoxin [Chromatium okenii]MBV5310412.1 type II toxin-antitoxin system HicB family antitoxin [Chromatium okenii]PQJ95844.1 hypothetical protein CXB77_11710 [Chromatium okenii]PQJ96375.1 hypothetical protein CXB77_11660 [Chromatium okenii]
MRFLIAIEPSTTTTAFGVVVPDLPGCFSAGDTIDEALDSVLEAIDLHLEGIIEDGGEIPLSKPIAEHLANPDFAGWIWAIVTVDISRFEKQEEINISLPNDLLIKLDDYVRAHGTTRSSFFADAVRIAMR